MTGPPAIVARLLAECEAHGIRLIVTGDGGLTIDAPQDALTPDLLDRLKAHKPDLLAKLWPVARIPVHEPTDAAAVWQAALGLLAGDPLFKPSELQNLRECDVRWGNDAAPPPNLTPNLAPPAKPVCRCGGTT